MTDSARLAKDYYEAMSRKRLSEVERFLSPKVEFIGPLAEIKGKEAVLKAIKGFMSAFINLSVRSLFHDENEVMLVIDTDFPRPMGKLRTASLLTIQEALIVRIELFYDSRVIENKKDEVFSS